MERTPRPNEIYQHFKGNLYRVVTLAKHADTGQMLVIYQALYGSFEVFARPLAEFAGKVDRAKYPDEAAEYRFTLLPQIVGQASEADRPEMRQEPDTAQPQSSGAGNPESENRRQTEPDRTLVQERTAPTKSADIQPQDEQEEPALDPMLLAFLDADTYEEKLAIFTDMRGRVTDDMLTTMAVSMDIDLKEGELMDRYEELKNCIIMREKYECNRLR